MGVYVFLCREGWMKVGHHMVTKSRPNAYYRVAGRGFYSVVHPEELSDQLSVEHLQLRAWFPSLTRADEGRVHRICDSSRRCGEFHPQDELDTVLAECAKLGGVHCPVDDEGKKAALQWGRRRARRALAKRRIAKPPTR